MCSYNSRLTINYNNTIMVGINNILCKNESRERIHQVTNTIRIANTGWRIRYVSRIHFFSEAKLGNG